MNKKATLFRNLINHEVFNIWDKLQDLQENFHVLFGEKILLFDKYNLFETQLNLVRAHIDRLCQISSRLEAQDIVDNLD